MDNAFDIMIRTPEYDTWWEISFIIKVLEVIESFKREKNYYYDIKRSALIGGFFDAFLYEKSAYWYNKHDI